MMFTDSRSKKIILIAHCILNQNAISDGTADRECFLNEIIDVLYHYKMGIVQMPCPELHCLGLDRGDSEGGKRPVVIENTRIRDQMSHPVIFAKLKEIVNQLLYQVDQYINFNFKILGIIGVNRSPSCGVETTSRNNQETTGKGLFITELQNELVKRDIHPFWLGVKTSQIEESIKLLTAKLETASNERGTEA